MKRCCALLLTCLLSPNTKLYAADISPSHPSSFDLDLARPVSKLEESGDVRFSSRFAEAHDFNLDPDQSDVSASSFIQRELHLSTKVLSRLELGLAIRANQESVPIEDAVLYGQADYTSRPMSNSFWARVDLFKNRFARTTLTLEFMPGQADKTSFHQSSQDRTMLAVAQELKFTNWLQSAVYAIGTHREDEKYRSIRIADEIIWGARLTVGPRYFHVFGDALDRQLLIKKNSQESVIEDIVHSQTIKAGVGSSIGNFDVQAYSSLPAKSTSFGLSKRAFSIALSYTFTAHPRSTHQYGEKNRDLDEETDSHYDHKPKHQWKPDGASGPNQVQEEILEDAEPDEFQLLDQRLAEEAKHPYESPATKAERELKSLREAEKIVNRNLAIEDKKRQLEALRRARKDLDRQETMNKKYRNEVNDEISQFALPDAEELNWKGLQDN